MPLLPHRALDSALPSVCMSSLVLSVRLPRWFYPLCCFCRVIRQASTYKTLLEIPTWSNTLSRTPTHSSASGCATVLRHTKSKPRKARLSPLVAQNSVHEVHVAKASSHSMPIARGFMAEIRTRQSRRENLSWCGWHRRSRLRYWSAWLLTNPQLTKPAQQKRRRRKRGNCQNARHLQTHPQKTGRWTIVPRPHISYPHSRETLPRNGSRISRRVLRSNTRGIQLLRRPLRSQSFVWTDPGGGLVLLST